ncbi:hypothetical protein [Roseofilum casamattae]|uniref:Uncharacterized protein n=1 Tax=Roseofilum casamattae BLCC-M143 TaxID=3022442 RepID=A0ABT7C285_9CYAN|nr:hypothetical protein [Roseofilum casamattae]MDJ1185536.1 hypothetical protein [Roseofilum casamattae BLCC-M143]
MRWSLRLWYERAIALIILANMGLVLFDATYVRWRSFHLWINFQLFQWRETPQEQYIQLVEQLNQSIVSQGLEAPQTAALVDLVRAESLELFHHNPPFRLLGKHSHLYRIEQSLLEFTQTEDIEAAIAKFWDRNFIAQMGWNRLWTHFNLEIRPLLRIYEPILDYDIFKGIEPDRASQQYVREVAKLRDILQHEGTDSVLVEFQLEKLRELTNETIDSDYGINLINKSGKVDRMKSRIKHHIYSQDPQEDNQIIQSRLNWFRNPVVVRWIAPELLWTDLSAKDAFDQFWSLENFQEDTWQESFQFLEEEIYFLVESMYYRHLDGTGEFADRFLLIDFPFLVVYWIDFICKVLYRCYREKEISLAVAIGSRSYDLLLLQPWFPGLRIIPLVIRFNQSEIINLEPVQRYLGLRFLASFGQDIVQLVVNRAIGQVQGKISQGWVQNLLGKDPDPAVNSPQDSSTLVLEKEEKKQRNFSSITNRVIEVALCNVLPEVSSDLETWLRYEVDKTLQKSTWYKRAQNVPGLRRFPDRFSESLVRQIVQTLTVNPRQSYLKGQTKAPDEIAQQLKERLFDRFRTTFQAELRETYTLEEVEQLLVETLERVKIGGEKSEKPNPPQLTPANSNPPQIRGNSDRITKQ